MSGRIYVSKDCAGRVSPFKQIARLARYRPYDERRRRYAGSASVFRDISPEGIRHRGYAVARRKCFPPYVNLYVVILAERKIDRHVAAKQCAEKAVRDIDKLVFIPQQRAA